MTRLARDGVASFSNVPLKIALRLGFLVSGISLLVGLATVGERLAGVGVPGWATIVVVVTFVGGCQLIVLGTVGEYVGRIYDEVKARPLYILRNAHGFEAFDRQGFANSRELSPGIEIDP